MTTRTRSSRKRPASKAKLRRGSTTWHIDPGTCFVCCCTEYEACDGGCYWVDPEQTLCSTCAAELGMLFVAWLRRTRP